MTTTPVPVSQGEALLRLRDVLDQLPAAVAVLRGRSHVIEFANAAYLELTGDRALVGVPLEEAIPEAVEQGFVTLLDEVLFHGHQRVGREVPAYVVRDDDVVEIVVDFTFQPYRAADGTVEGILVHAADVTASVQARRQLGEALRREEEDRFRQAVDSLMDTVILASPVRGADGAIVDFTVTFVNAGQDELGRRERSDLTGRRFSTLWPNVAQSGLMERYASVVASGTPVLLEDFGYADVVGGETVEAVFDIRATRLGDDLFLAFRDVTDRVRREQALAESKARLDKEHEVIRALQAAILPGDLPTVPGVDLGAAYVAASEQVEVGGDWFDVFMTPSGRLALAVGDVAGKGIDAAQVMAQVRAAGRVAAIAGRDPSEVLDTQHALDDGGRARTVRHDRLRHLRPARRHARVGIRRPPPPCRPRRPVGPLPRRGRGAAARGGQRPDLHAAHHDDPTGRTPRPLHRRPGRAAGRVPHRRARTAA